MKPVLLLGVNARYSHSCLALYYLKSVLEESDIPAVIREYNVNNLKLELLQEMIRQSPEIICVSIYIWNSDFFRSLLPDLKKVMPGVRIIAGGPEVSYNPQKWLNEIPEIDHIVCGNGESEIVSIVRNSDSPGIIRSKPLKLDEVSFPYNKLEIEDKNQHYFYYESSRGCPFQCSYCLSSRSDQKLEFRSLDKVFYELSWFMDNHIRHVKFVDRTFNADKKRARKIWEFLIKSFQEKPDSITDFHFEIHPELLEERDFEILQNVPENRFRFEIGIQTLHQPTLDAIKRKMNWEQVRTNLENLRMIGHINIHVDLIAGLPLEDFNTFGEGFDQVFKLEPQHLQLGFLKILPGTLMEEEAEQYGIVYQKSPPYQVLKTGVISFSELTMADMIEKLVEIYHNSHNFESFFKFYSIESPWRFFREFAEFCYQRKANLMIKKWEKSAKLLDDFCNNAFSEDMEYIRDCLRIEYCKKSRGHVFPEFLKNTMLDQAYKQGYDYIHNRQGENIKITPAKAKSAIYFKAVCVDFPGYEFLHIFTGLPAHKRQVSVLWKEITQNN